MNRSIVQSVILGATTLLMVVVGYQLSAEASAGDLFMPHAHCYLFNRNLMRLHGGSDLLIGLSYVAISATLVWLVVRARRELPFHWVMIAFAIFIVACGATHLMELWTLTSDNPRYWTSGWVKLVTAIASLTTAAVLPPLIPRVLGLLESARLSAARRSSLERAYAELNERYSTERSPDLATLVRELAEAKAAAESANTSKDAFLSILSHELRTPLTPALAAASALETDPSVDRTDLRETLAIIRRNIELEARLVDDLLDHTRITRGKLRIQSHAVDLRAPLHDALGIAEPTLRGKGIVVTTEIASEPLLVRGDGARLAQVFSNLLTNAAKFTPNGGKLEVRAHSVAEEIRVEVIDSGIGIEPEELPNIFEAFRQGSEVMTQRFGGLGLGLSVAKNLVEAHGGRIEARSEGRDRGATFVVTLPELRDRDAVEAGPQTSATAPATPALRILLVEDHEDSRAVLHRLLERWGHDVRAVGTVADAQRALKEGSFDLLLSDLGLPDGSGLEVAAALRLKADIPAVAMSGYGMEADLARSRAAGFSEHIVKPVSADQLRDLLARVAGLAQL